MVPSQDSDRAARTQTVLKLILFNQVLLYRQESNNVLPGASISVTDSDDVGSTSGLSTHFFSARQVGLH